MSQEYKLILSIDSKDKKIGETSSNFSFDLPAYVGSISKLILQEAEIPYSFYAISEINNKITITEYDGAGINPLTYTVNLSYGNYDPNSFVNVIETELRANSVSNGYSLTYNVVFSIQTGKFNINNDELQNFDLDFQIANSMYDVLGFEPDIYTGTSNYTGDNVSSLIGPNYIYVKSQVVTGIDSGLIPNNSIDKNILGRIQINTSPFGVILYKNLDLVNGFDFYHLGENISNVNLQLTYRNNNFINLNGRDWSCQILLIYKKK